MRAQLQRLAPVANFIERNELLAKFYILMLCLMFVLPNAWAVRTMYYFILLPMFLVVVSKDELRDIARSPITISAAAYFLVFAIVAPFSAEFSFKSLADHIRTACLVLSFLAVTAYLVRRNPKFPFLLFLFVAAVAAISGLNNVWRFYQQFPARRILNGSEEFPGS